MTDKGKRILAILGILSAVFLAGCAFPGIQGDTSAEDPQNRDTGFLLTGPGSYDSADTAVITAIDTQEKTITLYNWAVSKKYTLNYDGTCTLTDKYGNPLTAEQLNEGDIVDVTFLKSKKQLASMTLSESSWIMEAVSRYTIDARTHNVTIGEDVYKITEDTKIFSEGREVEMMDLNDVDILTFQGIDSTIYSMSVDKGHGYLRLDGDENFIGGWIEVGQNIIHQITEDMLLTVPEGSYQVNISITGGGGVKNVKIGRNEEVSLDISDLEIAEPQFGTVLFAITPSTASLYIDGTIADASLPISLEYGIHQLIVRADGYSSITRYLKVAQESAGIEIELELESEDDEEEEDTSTDVSGNTVSSGDTTTGYYRVYIDAPEGVEVYVDGAYVGISPVSFRKVEGSHTVILRKTGYETRSYSIEIDDEDKDVSYSFAELTAS